MDKELVTHINEDEIDLIELFKVLINKKLFITIFTSTITIMGIMISLNITPIYEVKSNVQIGFIGEELITDPDTLIKTVDIIFNTVKKSSENEKFISEVTEIIKNKNTKNFIEIKTNGISNEEALNINKEVVDYIRKESESKYEEFIINIESAINNLERKFFDLEQLEIKNLKIKIESLKTQEIIKIEKEMDFYKNIK